MGCVSSTGETMSVGRLVGWLAGRLVGFDDGKSADSLLSRE